METPERPKGLRIGSFQRRALYLSSLVLLLSGVMWLAAYYFLGVQTDYGIVPSEYELRSLQVHGAAAPLFLLVFGSLFSTHIVRAYKSGINRVSGLALLGFIGILIGTGYFLYYCGEEGLRSVSSVVHSSIGLVAAPLLVFHVVRGRKLITRHVRD